MSISIEASWKLRSKSLLLKIPVFWKLTPCWQCAANIPGEGSVAIFRMKPSKKTLVHIIYITLVWL